jgi:peptidoglycan/xylan/chitin deacetylase (PgdA/CDA1 family)
MKTQVAAMGLLAGSAAGAFAYAARSPGSQIFGRTLIAGPAMDEIALTFDDGPNDPYTHQLLDLLARHGVRATFFLVGSYVRQRPEIARAIHEAGHLLGNHTMTHPSLLWESAGQVWQQLSACNAAIEDATGVAVSYFRPPFGARRPGVFRAAADLGLTPVMWNITAHDWDATNAQTLAANVERGIQRNQRRQRGSNVLLHDGGHLGMGVDRSVTLAATSLLLDSWAHKPYRLVTIDAWGR